MKMVFKSKNGQRFDTSSDKEDVLSLLKDWDKSYEKDLFKKAIREE